MKREMLKSYESPLTVRTQVALESGICAGSADIENTKKSGGIEAQSVADTNFSGDFSNTSWE